VGGICRDITDRLLAEERLKSSRESLRELAWHVESVLEEERSRIARQIHDDLGQILTGLKMDLSWLEKKVSRHEEPIADKLVQMSQLIDETILLVQKISTELRPSLLDNLGLVAAVEWQANDFQKRTGTIVDLVLGADEMDIDRDGSTALCRIFQEALTNIARHSKATKVRVSLDEKDGQIVLAIKDNGRGISQEEISNPHSLGLIGMNERVHFLGGTFEIAGRQGEGTTLTVTIPHSADGTR
jgi:signal transduction histidine kinase